MRDVNDGTPIFGGEEHAREEIEALTEALRGPEPDTVRIGEELAAAKEVVESLETGWTAEALAAEPVLSSGQADDLHFEQGDTRLWLSRTGVADGEPFENTVSIERQIDGRWTVIAKYDGGALDDDVDTRQLGTFIVEIKPGNAEMQSGGHVANALRVLAHRLDFADWEGDGVVHDINGNAVGTWTFHDHNG